MAAVNSRRSMPITDAVYPRRKRRDDSTPEERLAEHLASKQVDEVRFGLPRTALAVLGQLGGKRQQRRPRQRRRSRQQLRSQVAGTA